MGLPLEEPVLTMLSRRSMPEVLLILLSLPRPLMPLLQFL